MESQKRIREAVKKLEGFNGLNKLYWLDVMVKEGQLLKAEAGYIIFHNLI